MATGPKNNIPTTIAGQILEFFLLILSNSPHFCGGRRIPVRHGNCSFNLNFIAVKTDNFCDCLQNLATPAKCLRRTEIRLTQERPKTEVHV